MKLFFILIFLTIILSSCASTSDSGELISSCSGITCSGHGKCKSTDGIPECKCETGYVNMGNECLFDCSNISNSKVNIYNNACECTGNSIEQRDETGLLTSCSCKNGEVSVHNRCVKKCDDPNASPLGENNNCICNSSYYLSINGACTFDCRNIPHSYTNSDNNGCSCEDNYEIYNNKCEYACNRDGNMIPNTTNSGCMCKTGFFQDKEKDICLNPCIGITCENDAECNAYNSKSYTCECSGQKNFKLNYNDKEIISNLSSLNDIQIATNNGNSYAIVWSANTSDTDNKKSIFITILNGNGEIIKEPFILNNDYDKNKLNPVIIWGGSKYLVAWEDYRYTTDAINTKDIFFRFVDESGTTTPETRLTFTSNNNSYAWNPKLLWNPTKSNYAIFWKEKKRDIDNNLGNTTIYYRIIKQEGDFLINFKPTTPANISIADFDISLNKDNDYSMLWISEDTPRRMYFQVLTSDDTVIDSDGVIKFPPINLVYNTSNINSPKLIWNGSEYAVFYKSSYTSNRYNIILLNDNYQKLGNEINLNISDNPRDLFWNGNEYIFTTTRGSELYLEKISWDGRITSSSMLSDGYGHTFFPRASFISSNKFSFYWLDNRDGKNGIYTSNLGCY